ncbi:MAG: hypothetical protein ACRC35_02200 [Angustibacter sp.]
MSRLLRSGRHLLKSALVSSLEVSLDRGGLVLGRDDTGAPVALPLFGDRHRTLATVLDQQLVMVLCYRALALGARLRILTLQPAPWVPLRRLGVDDPTVVAIGTPESVVVAPNPPRADRPLLVVDDVMAASGGLEPSASARVEALAWQCSLSMLPDLSMPYLPRARAAGTVVTRRLDPAQAVAAASFLTLPNGAALLGGLGPEQVAVVERSRATIVDLALTDAETQLVVAGTGSAVLAPPI